MTVTYSGRTSAVYDLDYQFIIPTNAANPRQVVYFWGTGQGPDPNDETRLIASPQNLTSLPFEFSIGNEQARVIYPGLDQIAVEIPEGISGCYASVYAKTGNFLVDSGGGFREGLRPLVYFECGGGDSTRVGQDGGEPRMDLSCSLSLVHAGDGGPGRFRYSAVNADTESISGALSEAAGCRAGGDADTAGRLDQDTREAADIELQFLRHGRLGGSSAVHPGRGRDVPIPGDGRAGRWSFRGEHTGRKSAGVE